MNDLSPELQRKLEDCLQALDGGSSLEECLSRYPEDASDLRPYLELRLRLTAVSDVQPPAGAYEAGRSRLLQKVAEAGVRTRTPLWPTWRRILFGEQWRGIARAGAGAVGILVLGVSALGVTAAGGYEPAQDALRPARDVLSALRIVPDRDDGKDSRESDQRPTERATDVPVLTEETREPMRDEPTPSPCDRDADRLCVDQVRPSPTLVRDARPPDAPVRDAKPPETAVSDEPRRPIDGPPSTEELPRDVLPNDSRVDEAEPTEPHRDTDRPER